MFDEIGSNILVTIETCRHQRDIIIIFACVYVGSVLNQTTHNSISSTARSGLQGSWTPRCSAVHLNVSFDLESYNINMTISSSGSQRCAVLDKRSPAVAANFESSSNFDVCSMTKKNLYRIHVSITSGDDQRSSYLVAFQIGRTVTSSLMNFLNCMWHNYSKAYRPFYRTHAKPLIQWTFWHHVTFSNTHESFHGPLGEIWNHDT